ncbi:MAG: hypothetical protein N5P05_001047 [Chroococcopsis gigantea SAG 12.99]|jgi:dnd system-associated protein 4|nr:DNA phosphorothioation-associated protein 4 [Chlorogloea purpurea SAG 13.99]MDV2999441.1 hypothetical protein [Chroococcopsis gigantea SAG 12.99]
MAVQRIRIPKDKAGLVQSLVDFNEGVGPFQTYADVMAFAATVGANLNRRVLLDTVAKEPSPISVEVFISRGYDSLIKLLAVVANNDPNCLSPYETEAEALRISIFEEYANAGLEHLQNELRGAVDYTERLLLVLSMERFQDSSVGEDFDLTRFL